MENWRLNLRKRNFEELFESEIFEDLIWEEMDSWKFVWKWHFKKIKLKIVEFY